MACQTLAATLRRYLLCDGIEPSLGLGLALFLLSLVGVSATGTVLALVWLLWATCAFLLMSVVGVIRVSRRRFRALPSFVQQFWRQQGVKTLGTRLPWN